MRRPAIVACALLVACSDEAAPPRAEALSLGDYRVVLDEAAGLRLERRGEVLLAFDASSWQLGVQPDVNDDVLYNPYRLYDPTPLYTVPDELRFVTPTRAAIVSVEPGALVARLDYGGGRSATLSIKVEDEGRFACTLLPEGKTEDVAYFRLRPAAGAQEGFYGLGEYFDEVSHRGQVRAMQIEVAGQNSVALESSYNEAHVPVPLLIGTRGWGLFVRSPYPGVFAVATEDDRHVEAAFGTGTFSAAGLDFYLYGADHPLDVTRHYFETTGYPRLPARWALGPWVWRDENDDQAQVEGDLDAIRDLDLATTGYWIDRPYATAVNTFDFEPKQFPDPQAMVGKMHALGFRTALWHTPYLDAKHSAAKTLREYAADHGFYPSESGPNLNGWGTPLDLTNPEAVAWWRENLKAYVDLGIEGFKLDYAEDVIAGATTKRFKWAFADGSDERTQHSQYQRHYHSTYAELLPEDGGFLLCRAGTYGDQQNGVIVWPGDLDASFARHGEALKDKDGKGYVAVGGLPASLVAALSLGPSGFLFYGSDTGGYRHCPPDNETFSRWFEQTALSTVMQIGTSCNDVAWEPTADNGFDAALLDRYREYTRLHLRLFPYLWTYATRALDDGRPIMRALGLAHPELGVHPNDVYLLGDALLVAPVVERGVTSRTVLLPEGTWVHWFTGEVLEGGEHTVAAPLGRLPLFLSASALVPLLRPTIDTLAPTSEPDRVDSYATTPGVLTVRGVARHDASFTLFDGTELSQTAAGVLSYAGGGELGLGALFELLAAGEPTGVTIDGAPAPRFEQAAELDAAANGWRYDAKGKLLWVKLPGPKSTAELSGG